MKVTLHHVLLILWFNCFWIISSYAAPLLTPGNRLERTFLTPVVTTACSPNGRCWKVLPLTQTEDANIVAENLSTFDSRLQTRRQITDVATDSAFESWRNDGTVISKNEVKQSSLQTKRVPNKNVKKDTFLQRGWGPGGMPFSVLYMSPHGPRSNHAGITVPGMSQQQETGKVNGNPNRPLVQPNYRVSVKNGTFGQSRRQYPIIPQLFISYGWGALGK